MSLARCQTSKNATWGQVTYCDLVTWPLGSSGRRFFRNVSNCWLNSYGKFGGATRRRFFAICEKPQGGGGWNQPPPPVRGLTKTLKTSIFYYHVNLLYQLYHTTSEQVWKRFRENGLLKVLLCICSPCVCIWAFVVDLCCIRRLLKREQINADCIGVGTGGATGAMALSPPGKIFFKSVLSFLNTIYLRKTIHQDEESTNLHSNPLQKG